jgi:hypothetical protein
LGGQNPPADSIASSISFINPIVSPGAMVIFQTLKVFRADACLDMQGYPARQEDGYRKKPLGSPKGSNEREGADI